MKFKTNMHFMTKKKVVLFLVIVFAFGFVTINAASNKKVEVGFLNTQQQIKNDHEVQAALKFLRSDKNFNVKVISFEDLIKQPSVLKGIDVVWYHRSDSSVFSSIETNQNIIFNSGCFQIYKHIRV